jgi:hypothetical protein
MTQPDLEIGSQEMEPAQRIKELYVGLKVSARTSAEAAWQIGKILEEQAVALQLSKYGNWEKWFNDSVFEFKIRTAYRWRSLFRKYAEGSDKLSEVTQTFLALEEEHPTETETKPKVPKKPTKKAINTVKPKKKGEHYFIRLNSQGEWQWPSGPARDTDEVFDSQEEMVAEMDRRNAAWSQASTAQPPSDQEVQADQQKTPNVGTTNGREKFTAEDLNNLDPNDIGTMGSMQVKLELLPKEFKMLNKALNPATPPNEEENAAVLFVRSYKQRYPSLRQI